MRTSTRTSCAARIEAAIQKKVEGKEISVTEVAPQGEGKVIDLMEALRASLAKTETAARRSRVWVRARLPSASRNPPR